MRKLSIVGAAVSLFVSSACLAADMAPRAYKAPAPAPVYSWTGCYLGAGAGYGMFNQNREVIAPVGTTAIAGPNFAMAVAAPPGAVITGNENLGGKGWLATAQLGCDYQFASNWLVGAFADGDWTNMRGDHGLFGIFRGEQSLRWSWAVGGRVGWLVTPTLLAYISGGYTQAEFGGVDYTNNFATAAFATVNGPVAFALASTGAPGIQLGSQRYDGFFIGGGTEYSIGWLPGLFWKNEYRYADYRSATTSINCVNAAACGALRPIGISEHIRPTVQTVRTALVWRFGGPVSAKY
jgi:outer membrane immunogenic protein